MRILPYVGTDEDHMQLVRRAGFVTPTFLAHPRYDAETGPHDPEIFVNAPNLADGIASIGLDRPLECTVDAHAPEEDMLTYDPQARNSQLTLTTTAAELTIPAKAHNINSLFWLGSIVAAKVSSVDFEPYSAKRERIIMAKISAFTTTAVVGPAVLFYAIPGDSAPEAIAGLAVFAGGIWGNLRTIKQNTNSPSIIIEEGLKNDSYQQRAAYMAVRLPVLELVARTD